MPLRDTVLTSVDHIARKDSATAKETRASR
jgi:hypothetical protein